VFFLPRLQKCFSAHDGYWSRNREMIRTAPRGPAKATGEAGGYCMEHAPNTAYLPSVPVAMDASEILGKYFFGIRIAKEDGRQFFQAGAGPRPRMEGHPKEARACLYLFHTAYPLCVSQLE
jgi:hypothetical protein